MNRRYRSRFDKRPLRKRVLIFTEGKTERDYLNCLKSRRQTGIKIKAKSIGEGKLALVEKVIRTVEKTDILEDEQVWVVLDRDQTAGDTEDRGKFISACVLADDNDIRVAYSNNSFELWPLLHLQDIRVAMSNDELKDALSGHFNGEYVKDGKAIHGSLEKLGDRQAATNRAEKLLAMHDQNDTSPADANPSTTIHRLINEMG